jgi:hypothetical protein
MSWDLRHTLAPEIDNGYADFFMMGELRHNDLHANECQFDPLPMKFS